MYRIIFDEVMLNQFKKLGKDRGTKDIISKIFDKIENLGPDAGKLLDSQLRIYEIKRKRPLIRLYYKISEEKKEAYIFEYEMKTSKEKQRSSIERIKWKSSSLKS